MSLAFPLPGTISAVLNGLDLRAQLALRNELRRLRGDADAVLAALFLVDGGKTELIEYAGDRALLPVPVPTIECSVPSLDNARCADLDHHFVVMHSVRIGRGWPSGRLAVVDAGLAPPALVDAVENAGARLETTLVGALSRKR